MLELNFDGTPGRNNNFCGLELLANLLRNHAGEIYYKSLEAEISTVEQI